MSQLDNQESNGFKVVAISGNPKIRAKVLVRFDGVSEMCKVIERLPDVPEPPPFGGHYYLVDRIL